MALNVVGGTPYERQQVVDALAASSFDWAIVTPQVEVHIVPGGESAAVPGEVWLDARLLDAGRFSWGVIQHEFGHQVDFLLFDDSVRAQLLRLLGGKAWCWDEPGLAHADNGCERFASTLAWSYWQSPDNCMRPQANGDESAAMAPAAFRRLLARILAARSTPSRR